jgi:hypothetical protein
VKNSVDKPIIIARVPTMDNRSFQRLIFLYPQFNVHGTKVTYILYYVVFNITIHFCYFLFLNSIMLFVVQIYSNPDSMSFLASWTLSAVAE